MTVSFYSDIDNVVHRILFSDFSSVALGQFHYYVLAENTTSVIYCFENGDIYIMSCDAREGEKIGTFTRTVEFSAISDDGKISVWTAMNGDKETIYLHDGNEKSLSASRIIPPLYPTFSQRTTAFFVVVSAFRESMWIKRPDNLQSEYSLTRRWIAHTFSLMICILQIWSPRISPHCISIPPAPLAVTYIVFLWTVSAKRS